MSRLALADELQALLPAQWARNAVVAGGFAASPQLAHDIDLWVLGVKTDEDVWNFTADMKEWFREIGLDANFEDGAAEYPNAAKTVTPFKPIMKMASTSVEMPPKDVRFGWMPVQIMATAVDTVVELLATFDLSVHKHAWTLQEPDVLLSAPDATLPTEETMRITRFDTPERTYQRVQRFRARYGVKPHLADMERLLAVPTVQQMVNGELTEAA